MFWVPFKAGPFEVLHHVRLTIGGADLVELFADRVAVLRQSTSAQPVAFERIAQGVTRLGEVQLSRFRITVLARKGTGLGLLGFGAKIIADESELDGIGCAGVFRVILEAITLEVLHQQDVAGLIDFIKRFSFGVAKLRQPTVVLPVGQEARVNGMLGGWLVG